MFNNKERFYFILNNIKTHVKSRFIKIIAIIIVMIGSIYLGSIIRDRMIPDSDRTPEEQQQRRAEHQKEFRRLVNDGNITRIKNGESQGCPNATFGQMVNSFFESSSWKGGRGQDGTEFVDVHGSIPFLGKSVRATIQFVFRGNGTFKVNTLDFDGVIQKDNITYAVLERMCESTK